LEEIRLAAEKLKGKFPIKGAFFAVLAAVCVLAAGGSHGAVGRPSHLDRFSNPGGCDSCHSGKGSPGTALLKKRSYQLCFDCHGTHKAGVRGEARTDIEREFRKRSKHPVVETAKYHSRGEVLPETNPIAPRHVACEDCHRVHASNPDNALRGASGFSPRRQKVRQAAEEYELCYRCHSESANMPAGTEDLIEAFNPANPSYHPVELAGRNKRVPSLIKPLTVNDRISCRDCHGNNDPNGPRGPHGSDYEPLLVREYRMTDSPESTQAYALCYGCHDRQSILGDQSFKSHKLHIVYQGTSCRSCHAAHGSREHPFLIKFSRDVVRPGKDGGPRIVPGIPGKPYCYLSCHGADHTSAGVGAKKWPW
jgi:predicted CXXCH cytochrome family protein